MKIDEAAARLEALGNPTRLKIYRMLVRAGDPGLPVGKLQSRLSIPASTLSHHLKTLIIVGLVSQERDATTLNCRANYPMMRGLVEFLVAECCTESASNPRRPPSRFAHNFDVTGRMDTMLNPEKTVAIIGGGPVGLAAAAHALGRGLKPIVLEAGDKVGHAVRKWSHVRMFSPWSYNIDKAAEALLSEEGWNSPEPERYPTGGELVAQYLEPLATRTKLRQHIHTNARIVSVGRVGFDKVKTAGRENAPFEIRYQNGKGPSTLRADAVIDASGTWDSPNPAGVNGLEVIGEAANTDRIAYGMPDVLRGQRVRYANKVVAVLGAGHSAVGTILDLAQLKKAEPATEIVWVLRGDSPAKSFGGGANDKLSARGDLGKVFAQLVQGGGVRVETAFSLTHITASAEKLRLGAGSACCGRHIEADELIVATGFRPDLSFLRELRTSLDPALECPPILAPLIDPNLHSCGTVRPHGARELAQPEPGFYFAGMKSYGRAPTFLMMTGYEQVRSIVADIAGDKEAAERVELVLPETGVCSRPVTAAPESEGCCGGPAPAEADACCKQDADAKAVGAKTCGCS